MQTEHDKRGNRWRVEALVVLGSHLTTGALREELELLFTSLTEGGCYFKTRN
jgi:hypothetical protein